MAGIQFMGLSSGLDTESIVTAMLSTHKAKINKQTSEKTKLEWKKDVWTDMNNSINKFYSDYVDKLRMQSTFQKYKTSSSSSAIDVKQSGSLPVGTHKVQVAKLATELFLDADMDRSIDDKYKSFKDLGLLNDGEETKLKVNEKEIQVSSNMTLADLETKMKACDSTLNVNFDVKNKKLFVSSKETGSKAKINIETSNTNDSEKDFFKKLGLNSLYGVEETIGTQVDEYGQEKLVTIRREYNTTNGKTNIQGSNAVYTYNGVLLESDTNDVEVNGLKMTFNSVTSDEVLIKVESDPDSIVDFLEDFTKAYNELLSNMYKKYNASAVIKDVLTDEEKEKLSDKQVDKYEQDIKDSLLRRDSSLYNVIQTLRSSIQTVVKDNKYGSLFSIGFETEGYLSNGKLKFDKDKFKKAFEEDPDSVINLFTASGTKSTGEVDESKMGVATKINKGMQALFKRVENARSYQSYYYDILNKDKIKEMKDKITDLEDKYKALEKSYYKKFTAMEKALSSINAQGSSITNMLGTN